MFGGTRHGGRIKHGTNEQEKETSVILAQKYLARYETPFAAYMALQRALLLHYLSRGGTEEHWCQRIAPIFRRRYHPVFAAAAREMLKN
ncbi:MAG: hypothetical protein ACT4O1_02195 [Gemmatimonadota bacterium]